MKKSYRVKREQDFTAIFKEGQNVANRKFVVYRLNQEQTHFRVGLSVSKKLGNAVTRNLIKRRLRHLILELKEDLLAEDFVVIARRGVQDLTYQEMRQNLQHVLKLAKLYQEGQDSETQD